MAIPRRLHFLWGLLQDDQELPPDRRRVLEQWRGLHPGWQLLVHRRAEVRELARCHPEQPFDAYERDIQRCDVCRPMLLHRSGGIYCDLDLEPRRALGALLARYPEAGVLLAVEVVVSRSAARRVGRTQPIRAGRPEIRRRLANYFLASVPGHPFWLDVLELARERAHLPIRDPYDVLFTTGPDLVTEAAERAQGRYPDLQIVPRRIANRFFTHHCAGSWRGL